MNQPSPQLPPRPPPQRTSAAPSMAALARHPLALTQDQLLTRAQLVALGCADSTTSHRCRPGGPWRRVLPRVQVLHSGTPTPRQRMRAALLYAGERALLTGLAALALHNFRSAPRPERLRYVDVLVPYGGVGARGASAAFVRVHRTRRMPENFPVAGLGVAAIARAVADAVPGLTCERDVTAVLAEAVQRGFCTPEALLAELGASHRRYAPYVARAKDHLRAGVHSPLEADARALVLRHSLPEPLWNPNLHDPLTGTFLARPDAYWPAEGLALEVDSREYHLDPDSWRRTLSQRNRLARAGLPVLAITAEDLRWRGEGVAGEIRVALAATRRNPAPLLLVNPAPRSASSTSRPEGRGGRRPEGRAGSRPRGGSRR
ncbi:hypothetical protein [Streptomyces endophyticus]|uniref:DUF559 domain-containing protein n=1 Tax=Streptomyces endophyticus TaxID=714166 RepID=A0ABU6F4S0_9ACTN|nr:hypothetical protein [Streptomyces endophyticus]MEB8337906.1 hypothetical protein [Streptomyces endophyticus]